MLYVHIIIGKYEGAVVDDTQEAVGLNHVEATTTWGGNKWREAGKYLTTETLGRTKTEGATTWGRNDCAEEIAEILPGLQRPGGESPAASNHVEAATTCKRKLSAICGQPSVQFCFGHL